MRMIFYYLLFLPIVLQSCTAQKSETFWRSEHVKQIEGKPLMLANSGYAEMISQMQIHLSKTNDSLHLFYPFEKQLNIEDFKSISNCRLETGNLLDSVYAVEVEKDSLRIKFYFNGRETKDRYVLTLSSIDQQKFWAITEKIKEHLLTDNTTQHQPIVVKVRRSCKAFEVADTAELNIGSFEFFHANVRQKAIEADCFNISRIAFFLHQKSQANNFNIRLVRPLLKGNIEEVVML